MTRQYRGEIAATAQAGWWYFAFSLLAMVFLVQTAFADASGHRTIRLTSAVTQVVDGDTFDADLNGDGRVEPPSERVRLLYVDAPELHDSPKGKDAVHGAPAKAALEALLQATPVALTISDSNARDTYGRTLARVTAGGVDVNLALIQQGYSYFDTRFTVPPDYDALADAEGEAFDARRGIWADAPSRKRYLNRLRGEGKTPRSAMNARYVPGILPADRNTAAKHIGNYVTVEGSVTTARPVKGGGYVLHVRKGNAPSLKVYASGNVASRLGVSGWPPGTTVRAEGFVQRYKGSVELALHHGWSK